MPFGSTGAAAVSADPGDGAQAATTLPAPPGMSPGLAVLISAACALIAGNLYYAQPLTGPISRSLEMSQGAAGLIVTMTQVGYGAGLLLLAPLGDLFENRKLVVAIIGVGTLALAAAALSTDALQLLVAAGFIGLGSVAVQVLVPYAAHLTPEAVRGRVVGRIMSGLMLGVMLARPVSSFIAQASSWNVVFAVSSVLMVAVGVVLWFMLPQRHPTAGLRYGALLGSMGRLALRTPTLQRVALLHCCMFAAFSLFWTTVPLWLADGYRLTQTGIALFAIAGVAGAISAPIAGWAADRGWGGRAAGGAMALGAAAFLLGRFGLSGTPLGLATLVVTAIMIDFGVQANMVISQRTLFTLGAEVRSRLNGLFMATFFLGGAAGSALGGWAYATGGWPLASWIGFALSAAGLLGYLGIWAVDRRAMVAVPAEI